MCDAICIPYPTAPLTPAVTTLFEKATLSTEDHDANLQGSAEQNLGATFQASNTQGVQTQPILEFSNPYPPTEVMYTAGYNGMQQGVVNPPWQQPSPAVVYHDPAAVYTVPGIDGGVFSDAMPGYLLSEDPIKILSISPFLFTTE
eukprot:gene31588-39765_t